MALNDCTGDCGIWFNSSAGISPPLVRSMPT